MSQDLVMNLDFNEFERLVKSPDFKVKTASIQHLIIRNPKTVVHFPLVTKQELPINGILFPYMQEVLQIENLKELRLVGLSVNNLPAELLKLKNLRMLTVEFSSSASENIDHIIKVLSNLQALKELDIMGSRLTIKNLDRITKVLKKKGVKIDFLVYVG